jgi:hypothetical protein
MYFSKYIKKIIHYSVYKKMCNDTDNICPVCFELLKPEEPTIDSKKKPKVITNIVVSLDCKHTFHYECIIDWFKQKKMKHPYSNSGKNIRVCPYCREKTDYLELPKNTFPIKFIHKEYLQIEEYILSDNHAKLMESCAPFFNHKCCLSILKTGASKGQQCRKHKSKESNFCFIHKKKYDTEGS